MEALLQQPRKRPNVGSKLEDDTDIQDRPHDPLIETAIEEEQAAKRAKKSGTDGGKLHSRNS